MQDVLGVQQACPRVLSGGHACFSGRTVPDPPCIQLLGRQRSSLPVHCTAERQQVHQKPSHRRAGRAQAASFTMWQPDSGAGSGDDAASGQRATKPRSGKSWRLGAAQNDGRLNRPLRINLDLKLYKARQARKEAYRAFDNRRRNKMMLRAENILRDCLNIEPSDGRAYVSLGRILVESGRFAEARALYADGTRLTESQNAFIWAAWAYLEARSGNAREARKLYDASTVADPEHAAAWHGWGLLEKQQGNLLAARDLWLKGISKTKKRKPNPYLYQSVAVLAAEMGLTESARDWFQRGTSTFSGQSSHAMWVSWALMEAQQGDATAARYLFKRCMDVGPRSRYLHLAWAKYELYQGKKNNARLLLERGHLFNPKDAAILQALARLEEEEGNIAAARNYFGRGSEADPTHIHIWQAWGVMEFRRGHLAKARELFQQGVWADSNSRDVAYIWQAWGVLEKKAKNYQLARKLFRCAVKAMPQSEPSWQAWAQMEAELGFFQRADDLRRYSLEEQQEVVPPRNFADPDSALAPTVLDPILDTIAKWGKTFEEARARTSRRPAPSWLDPDGTPLPQRQPPPGAKRPKGSTAAFGSGVGPFTGDSTQATPALAAGSASSGAGADTWKLFSVEEQEEMQRLRDGGNLRLPDSRQHYKQKSNQRES